jgi:hypothetical protein
MECDKEAGMRCSSLLAAGSVCLSITALILSIHVSVTRAPVEPEASSRVEDDFRAALASLEKKAGSLEARLRSLEDGLSASRSRKEGASRPGFDPQDLQDLRRRLAEVEGKLPDIPDAREEIETAPVERPQPPGAGRSIEEEKAIAIDRSVPPDTRIQSLSVLRARGGRTREVVLEMIELIRDPGLAPRLRAAVIRNLSHLDLEELKQPLLDILVSDADPETRSEAVETLEAFYGDPAVRKAVENVRDNDASPEVREEAARRLDRRSR